jgi:hypothetical protein
MPLLEPFILCYVTDSRIPLRNPGLTAGQGTLAHDGTARQAVSGIVCLYYDLERI